MIVLFEFQSQNGLILTVCDGSSIKAYVEFQSQNGLILTFKETLSLVVALEFQSQNGLILTPTNAHSHTTNTTFQSQNGLILTFIPFCRSIHFCLISIPKWSDFNSSLFYSYSKKHFNFNPKMV